MDKIDLKSRTVTLTIGATEPGIPEEIRTLEADYLVIALGSVTNFRDLPGISEHSLTIKSLGDAAAIRNRALALLERANAEPDGAKRRALLTVVVGGGFSGVETMAAVNDLLRDGTRRYPNLQVGDVQSMLIHPGERLLPELGERLAAHAKREMEQREVTVKLKTEISGAGDGFVRIKDQADIAAHLLIWAGGVSPLAIVGKRARVYGMEFSGLLAWAMWRAIYLIKMPSLRKRVRIVLGWGWDMLFEREVFVLPTAHSGAIKP